jgi:glycosyltransferase involved in cell wall biosynthesis
MNLKVLMLLYRFPPMGGSGVQRSLKFVKYLPEFGWEPVVLAAKGMVDISLDKGLVNEVPPDSKVYRIPSLELALFRPRRRINPSHSVSNLPPRQIFTEKLIRIGRKIKNSLSYFFIPDEQVLWSIFVIPVGIWICLTQRIEVIFASARPFSGLVSAVVISKLFRLRVVMDIRDPLTDGIVYPFGGLRRKLDRAIETFVLQQAHKVTIINSPLAEHYKTNFPALSKVNFIEIPNGYDDEDFRHIGSDAIARTNTSKFTLVHVGQIYPLSTEVLVEFLSKLRTADPSLFRRLSVRLVGGIPLPPQDLELLKSKDLMAVVSLENRVDHSQALLEMKRADVLLLLETTLSQASHMGAGKIYEYLRTGKPIIAFGPKSGVIPQIINEACSGQYYSINEIDSAIVYLQKLINGKVAIDPNWNYIYQFERKRQTKKLADILSTAK